MTDENIEACLLEVDIDDNFDAIEEEIEKEL